ncbi:flagellar basal body-associated FliL family protein [Xylophilus ampelinus]|uniref:Flagellar protein FliL n=1 Tax=Xylophilus ampelinus TaxID=54067 RepID=A0A318SGP6_9BURK|nr:flagellar basal body-associated FliL family protein [Xylophilus ampelinus]MCS4511752.1 flagellar basal body-associated FliL family protein [Xylophilus ampelinus]PYE73746.1 flagellar FliL protein [Xylophilus ampelinus]
MSKAAATATDAAAPVKKSKKKLVLALLVLVVLLGAGGAGAWWFTHRAAAAAEADEEDGTPAAEAHHDAPAAKPGTPPTFLPVDNMVVNLVDPGGDRFAQIGVTFEVADAKVADQLKLYMPSIRSAMLMLVSQRTAAELLQRDGKEKLAADIMAEAGKPLGYVPPDEEEGDASKAKSAKKKKKTKSAPNPVRGVLFSSFIIQ